MANQRDWTFAEVTTSCKAGTHRYRVKTSVYQVTVSDTGTGIWTTEVSYATECTC